MNIYETYVHGPFVNPHPIAPCEENGGDSMVAVHLNALEEEEDCEVSFQAGEAAGFWLALFGNGEI